MFSDIITIVGILVGVINIVVTCHNTYVTLKSEIKKKHQKSNRTDQS